MSSASFGTKIRFSKSLTKSITGYWIPTGSQNVSTTETGNYRLYGLNVTPFGSDDGIVSSSNATFIDSNNARVPIAIRKK